jgi:hypothetical protein
LAEGAAGLPPKNSPQPRSMIETVNIWAREAGYYIDIEYKGTAGYIQLIHPENEKCN